MKSILISIKPKYVAEILNHRKTIEIRKTAPKCDLPIEVYIYCTKTDYIGHISNKYVGKVVAKFTLKRIDDIGKYAYAFKDDFFYETLKDACLTPKDLSEYAPIKRDEWERRGIKLYAWRISDLVIFDEPKELDEFDYPNPSGTRYVSKRSINGLPSKKHPPQSWCYVEVKE